MTATILAVVAVYGLVFVVSYGLARLVQWAGHALPDLFDTEPEPNDTSEIGGPQ